MDVTGLCIARDDPGRIQFLQRMKETAGKEADGTPRPSAPVRKFVLHGDPAVAAASLAARDTAVAAETARREEELRQRNAQVAAMERESALRLAANQAAAMHWLAAGSGGTAQQNAEAARSARIAAEAQQETARAVREQTAALERHTMELRNLRETRRFNR